MLTSINISGNEINKIEEENKDYNLGCIELVSILQKCIRDFLPMEIKFFYHIIYQLSVDFKIDYNQTISLFFL